MKEEEIVPWDVKRILLGQTPAAFLLEILVRTVVVYLCLLVIVRLLGKRMSGQITILEMGVMLSLGAIVSVPVLAHNRGIVVGVLLLVAIMALHHGLSWWSMRSPKVEMLSQGRATVLARDGVMLLDELAGAALSREQLFAVLRGKGVEQLGQVRRVYLEGCGLFSVLRAPKPQPGLAVLRPVDHDLLEHDRSRIVCVTCGNTSEQASRGEACSRCGRREWTAAVIGRKKTDGGARKEQSQ
ncbi:membrane protein [Sorangium cellulosum]|uniref:Membrane protein n=1 Tax=Sorangium cellulosum TaxID=56 RepID=A0A2L0FAU6_SORCE|nr:YetF domain-containing protein [Sorangium cellulosum]AUX48684.1 membrane protein [Sorangium cellulosum]